MFQRQHRLAQEALQLTHERVALQKRDRQRQEAEGSGASPIDARANGAAEAAAAVAEAEQRIHIKRLEDQGREHDARIAQINAEFNEQVAAARAVENERVAAALEVERRIDLAREQNAERERLRQLVIADQVEAVTSHREHLRTEEQQIEEEIANAQRFRDVQASAWGPSGLFPGYCGAESRLSHRNITPNTPVVAVDHCRRSAAEGIKTLGKPATSHRSAHAIVQRDPTSISS
ncbi:MAG: hypothetical protein AAF797_02935 [Planctomycetota bacterium]